MKMKLTTACLVGCLAFPLFAQSEATTPLPAPDLPQVREILRTNLPEVTSGELDRYAFEGILQGLRAKVWLAAEQAAPSGPALGKSLRLEGDVAYVRLLRVLPTSVEEMAALCRAMNATNSLIGLVLDLRFAGGDDYAAAMGIVDLFLREEKSLLNAGGGVLKSTAKADPLPWPVAVLINGETMGAPEALAAVLRETGTGLLLGNPTRGAAVGTKEFQLNNGQRLRIAATPVQLLGATETPVGRVKPDIEVTVTPAAERVYLSDPYAVLQSGNNGELLISTNAPMRRPRTTEADLVRAHRNENQPGEVQPPRELEPEQPVIRDPALARAVDLLKGLAVVRRAQ